MILYALACDGGHRFESWFRDSAAFDEQASAGQVLCPVCRSPHVAKTIMAPAVLGTRPAAVPAKTHDGTSSPAPDVDAGLLDDRAREFRAMIRDVREKLVAEGHDVGTAFAAEARRIHEGRTPARQIYGQASLGDARDLLEDGILILPLPNVPEELN